MYSLGGKMSWEGVNKLRLEHHTFGFVKLENTASFKA